MASERTTDASKTPAYLESTPQWARMLRALYGTKFLDWETWQKVLAASNVNATELEATVTWMEENGWKEPQTVVDLRKAHFTRKKADRREAECVKDDGGCRFCFAGMLSWWPEIDVDDVARTEQLRCGHVPSAVLVARMLSRSMSTPCLCSAGERLVHSDKAWKNYDAGKRSLLDAERRRAMKQVEAIAIYEPRLVAKA